MNPLSRRNFLTHTAVAAGAVAVVGPLGPATAAAASAPGSEADGWGSAESVASEPFVVYIRNAKKGEVAVLSGEQEVVYVDRVLVGRLQGAVRRAGR